MINEWAGIIKDRFTSKHELKLREKLAAVSLHRRLMTDVKSYALFTPFGELIAHAWSEGVKLFALAPNDSSGESAFIRGGKRS